MNPTLIAALLSAAIGFASAWQWQDYRQQETELTNAKSQLAQEQSNSLEKDAISLNAVTAAGDAVTREIVLRADITRAGNIARGLRGDIANLRAARTQQATPPACVDAAAAAGELLDFYGETLGELSVEATDLAGKATRHTSDIQTLMQVGWPRNLTVGK